MANLIIENSLFASDISSDLTKGKDIIIILSNWSGSLRAYHSFRILERNEMKIMRYRVLEMQNFGNMNRYQCEMEDEIPFSELKAFISRLNSTIRNYKYSLTYLNSDKELKEYPYTDELKKFDLRVKYISMIISNFLIPKIPDMALIDKECFLEKIESNFYDESKRFLYTLFNDCMAIFYNFRELIRDRENSLYYKTVDSLSVSNFLCDNSFRGFRYAIIRDSYRVYEGLSQYYGSRIGFDYNNNISKSVDKYLPCKIKF